jgi:predicted phage gp36 major capsid-like protein
MPAKKPQPATTISAPKPPRRTGKGEPPKSASDSAAVGNNTTTGSDSKLVDLGFKVAPEYRKNFRLFCATHEIAQVDALKEAMADYMAKKGWEASR